MRQEKDINETDYKKHMEEVVGGVYLELPEHILLKSSFKEEVEFFADAYNKAKTNKTKDKAIRGLLVAGSRWDAVTRSIFMYPEFERLTHEKFPGIWR